MQDAGSPEGPSQFELQLWDAAASSQASAAASSAGCATTPVLDFCQQSGGPANALVLLRCSNPPGRPCRVRVAAYTSACPGGPQPQAVAIDAGGSGSSSAALDSGGGDLAAAPPTDGGSSGGSTAGGSSAVSPTVWVIAGVSVGAALLIGERGCWWWGGPASQLASQLAKAV